MSRPIPVIVHRPRLSNNAIAARIIVRLASVPLVAWWLMLLVPIAVPEWHPGFWQTLAGFVAIRLAQVGSKHLDWTQTGQKDDEERELTLTGDVQTDHARFVAQQTRQARLDSLGAKR